MVSATTASPQDVLLQGAAILSDVLVSNGFAFVPGIVGTGSGGHFASGYFVRGDRRLELHYRIGLGLVTYHIGEASMGHEAYLRYLGKWQEHRYPNYPTEPLESFRALAHDLVAFCSDFLSGPGNDFKSLAAAHADNPNRFKGFSALGKP